MYEDVQTQGRRGRNIWGQEINMNNENDPQTGAPKDPVTHPDVPDTPHSAEPEGAPDPPPPPGKSDEPNPYPIEDPIPGSDPDTEPVPVDEPPPAFPEGVPNVGF